MLVKCLSFSPNQPKKKWPDVTVFGEEFHHDFPVIYLYSPTSPKSHKSLPEAALASQKFSLDPKSKRYRHSFLQQPAVFKGKKPSERWGSENLDASFFVRSQKKNNGRDV